MEIKFQIYDFVFAALSKCSVYHVNEELQVIEMQVIGIKLGGKRYTKYKAKIQLITRDIEPSKEICLGFEEDYKRFFKTMREAYSFARKELDKREKKFWQNAMPTV